MKTIFHYILAKNTNGNSKFDHLTFSEDKLTLHYNIKEQKEISFAQVDQIFIKKYKIHPIVEFVWISSPFFLIFMTIQYSPYDLIIIASFFTIPPVFISVLNFKWYRLCVRLIDGTIYSKSVSLHNKTETISILEKLRTEYLNYKFHILASVQ